MPRQARCAMPNIIYHIIHRGNNKQQIFYREADYVYFIELMREAKEKYQIKLYSYVLMNNHIHLLAEPQVEDSMAFYMKLIAQKYAQHINRSYKRTGTLWEGRFKSSPVSNDEYLLACSRYIEMNPVRAKLVKYVKDYKWSSYPAKTGLEKNKILEPDPFYMALASTDSKRQIRYEEFFKQSIPEHEWKAISESLNKGVLFGNDKFRKQIEETLGRNMQIRRRGRPLKPK